MDRLEIDYSHYHQTDQQVLKDLDCSPKDMRLSSADLVSLHSEELATVYAVYRRYGLDTNGAETKGVGIEEIKTVVKQKAKDPVEYVRARARSSQFLLFGEKHASKNSRAFTADLIPLIKSEGYQYFAVEIDSDRQADVTRYMLTGDRACLNDLLIADEEFYAMLDACRSQDLKVICIDDAATHGDPYDRDAVDQLMYQHLEQEVLNANPTAKVFIYLGYFHINETHYPLFDETRGETPTTVSTTDRLGYLLEQRFPGKSHSINLIDRDLTLEFTVESALGKSKDTAFALDVNEPFFFSLYSEISIFKEVLGGQYDSVIVL